MRARCRPSRRPSPRRRSTAGARAAGASAPSDQRPGDRRRRRRGVGPAGRRGARRPAARRVRRCGRHVPRQARCRATVPRSMILVGLTGGIGSGKSTVSELLAAKGAVDHRRRRHRPGGAGAGPARCWPPSSSASAPAILTRRRRPRPAGAGRPRVQRHRRAEGPQRHRPPGRRRGDRGAGSTAQRDTDRVVVLDVPLLVEAGRRRTWPASSWSTCPSTWPSTRLVRVPGHERGRRPGPDRPPGRRARSGWRRPTGSSTTPATGRRWRPRSTSCGSGSLTLPAVPDRRSPTPSPPPRDRRRRH